MTEVLSSRSPGDAETRPPEYLRSFDEIPNDRIAREDVDAVFGSGHPLAVHARNPQSAHDIQRMYPDMHHEDVTLLHAAQSAGSVPPHDMLHTVISAGSNIDYEPKPFVAADNHEPVNGYRQEKVTTAVEAAVTNCAMDNYWSVVSAYDERPWKRVPLHAIRTTEEDEDEVAKEVAYGGAFYGADDLSQPNVDMLKLLARQFKVDYDTDHEVLETLTYTGEDESTTSIEIVRLPIRYGWTIDAAVASRVPREYQVDETKLDADARRLLDARKALYGGQLPIEEPSTQLFIWACPPGKGIETLYYDSSGKPNADGATQQIESELNRAQ